LTHHPLKVGLLTLRPFVRKGVATGQWVIDIPGTYSINGRRQRQLLEARAMAETEARRLWNIIRLEGGIPASRDDAARTTLSALFDAWIEFREERLAAGKVSLARFDNNTYLLANLRAQLGDILVQRLTERQVQRYQIARLKAGRKPRTINDETALLSQIFRWAKKCGLVERTPDIDKLPLAASSPKFIEREDFQLLLSHLTGQAKTLTLFLGTTGCRWGEAAQLEWTDVDEVNGRVAFRAYEGRTLKNAQSVRTVPLPDETLSALRHLTKTSRYVFPGKLAGEPIRTIKKALRTASTKAGLTRHGQPAHVTAQILRSSYATWMASGAVQEHVVQDLIGHERGSRVTKRHYIGIRDADMLEAVARVFKSVDG
jgi:integrase